MSESTIRIVRWAANGFLGCDGNVISACEPFEVRSCNGKNLPQIVKMFDAAGDSREVSLLLTVRAMRSRYGWIPARPHLP